MCLASKVNSLGMGCLVFLGFYQTTLLETSAPVSNVHCFAPPGPTMNILNSWPVENHSKPYHPPSMREGLSLALFHHMVSTQKQTLT